MTMNDHTLWEELEDEIREHMPDILEKFEAAYKPPRISPDLKRGGPASCERCGGAVTNSVVHQKWHRAMSLRIHMTTAFFFTLLSEFQARDPMHTEDYYNGDGDEPGPRPGARLTSEGGR